MQAPGGHNNTAFTFCAAWDLKDRSRRIVLLLYDCQEEYRPYAGGNISNMMQLAAVLREARARSNGFCTEAVITYMKNDIPIGAHPVNLPDATVCLVLRRP